MRAGGNINGITSPRIKADPEAGPVIAQEETTVPHGHYFEDTVRNARNLAKTSLARSFYAYMRHRMPDHDNRAIALA